jgi:hypothetical protein
VATLNRDRFQIKTGGYCDGECFEFIGIPWNESPFEEFAFMYRPAKELLWKRQGNDPRHSTSSLASRRHLGEQSGTPTFFESRAPDREAPIQSTPLIALSGSRVDDFQIRKVVESLGFGGDEEKAGDDGGGSKSTYCGSRRRLHAVISRLTGEISSGGGGFCVGFSADAG